MKKLVILLSLVIFGLFSCDKNPVTPGDFSEDVIPDTVFYSEEIPSKTLNIEIELDPCKYLADIYWLYLDLGKGFGVRPNKDLLYRGPDHLDYTFKYEIVIDSIKTDYIVLQIKSGKKADCGYTDIKELFNVKISVNQ